MNIKHIFDKTSIKIALVIALLFITMLSILNFIVVLKSKDAFVNVVSSVDFSNSDIQIQRGPNGFSIIKYNPDGTVNGQPLQEEFKDKVQSSLLIVGVIGIIFSFITGILASQVFTYPLRSISEGISNLRKNNYKQKLEKTDIAEIDAVIDEFNNLTSELERIEDLRNDLISDTSHELKTPLTSLNAQLEGIKDGVFEATPERIKTLMEQVNRLTDLVEKMEEYSRMRNKNQELNYTKINLFDLIEELKSLFEKKLVDAKIEIVNSIDAKYTLKADKNMLERIYINLIENAIKYSHSKKITVTASKSMIKFEDDGIGIPPKDQPYIFERFYRVEKSRNRKTGGLGLGLSLVQEIVEAHGWKIELVSPASEKKGTAFVIRFV